MLIINTMCPPPPCRVKSQMVFAIINSKPHFHIFSLMHFKNIRFYMKTLAQYLLNIQYKVICCKLEFKGYSYNTNVCTLSADDLIYNDYYLIKSNHFYARLNILLIITWWFKVLLNKQRLCEIWDTFLNYKK